MTHATHPPPHLFTCHVLVLSKAQLGEPSLEIFTFFLLCLAGNTQHLGPPDRHSSGQNRHLSAQTSTYCPPKKDYRPEIEFPNELEITLTCRYPKLIFRIKRRRNYPEILPPNAWALTQITRNRLRELIKDYPYPGLPGINFLN